MKLRNGAPGRLSVRRPGALDCRQGLHLPCHSAKVILLLECAFHLPAYHAQRLGGEARRPRRRRGRDVWKRYSRFCKGTLVRRSLHFPTFPDTRRLGRQRSTADGAVMPAPRGRTGTAPSAAATAMRWSTKSWQATPWSRVRPATSRTSRPSSRGSSTVQAACLRQQADVQRTVSPHGGACLPRTL